MIRAVIFDFDGVIANSEPLHFAAFRDVLLQQGVILSEQDYYGRYLGFDKARLARLKRWMQGYADTGRWPGGASPSSW